MNIHADKAVTAGSDSQIGRIPVVAREDHRRLLGLITRKNIISAYNRALMRRHTQLEQTQDEEHFE